MELDAYTFVLLRRGRRAGDYSGRMTAEIMTWLTRKGALE